MYCVTSSAANSPNPKDVMRTRFSRADLMCLLMSLIWGANMSITKDALSEISPLGYNGIRLMIAILLLSILARLLGEKLSFRRRDLWKILGLGLIGNTAYQLCFIFGLHATKAGNVGFLLASGTVFTALLSRILGHESLPRLVWVGIGISLTGVFLILLDSSQLGFSTGTLTGDLLILAGSGCWSLYTVFSKPVLSRYTSFSLTALTVAAGGFIFFLISLPGVLRQDWAAVSTKAYGELFFSALFAIAVGYAIWFYAIDKLGSTRTSVYGNLIPLNALLFASLFLEEQITPLQIAGGTLIIAGIYLTRMRRRRGIFPGRLGA